MLFSVLLLIIVIFLSYRIAPREKEEDAHVHGAGQIVPWIGLGVGLQGIYLLTSIGLNITKRTAYYPVTTGLATVAALGANLVLVPRFGAIGAAWSNVISPNTIWHST